MIAEILLIPGITYSLDAAKASAQQVGRALSAIGIQVREQISLCPGKVELQKAVAKALGRSNVVITLGGLGPDAGYLAKNVVAEGLRLPLETDQVCLSAIRHYCVRAGDIFALEDAELAKVPLGAKTFPGQFGKMPGLAVSSSKQHILLLPENPPEISPMLAKYIVPYLGGAVETTVTRTVRTYGIGETGARGCLGDLLDEANPAVTVQTEDGEVLVRVCARAKTHAQAADLCAPTLRAAVERLGDAAYGLDVDSLQSALIAKLRKKDLEIAVAECGTSGMLTRILAETDGGSDILRYSVAAEGGNMQKLGVSAKLLKKHGAVSEQVAVAMAAGAMEKAMTPIGVAVTAVPPEQSNRKAPLGLVYIAVCDNHNVYVKKLVVGKRGDVSPDVVLDAAVSRALNMVRLFVDYLPKPYPAAIDLDEALAGKTVTQGDSGSAGPDDAPENGEKGGFFTRLAENFLIRKTDDTRDKVRKIVFLLAILIFIGSAVYVGSYYYERYHNAKINDALKTMFETPEAAEIDLEEALENLPKGYLPQFAALYAVNYEIAGYIRIPDTPVSYPVMMSKDDNEFYLRRDFYGNSNQHGVPFLDNRSDLRNPPDNYVVYGHNMDTRMNGSDEQMFATLRYYKQPEYYREHPLIEFTTVYEEGHYKIISAFITNAYENQGPVFDYHNRLNFRSDEDFMEFVQDVTARSLIQTGVDVSPGDRLLTLSTCSYEFKDARFVVVARKVRDDEDDSVDTDAVTVNPFPLMPRIWYEMYGGSAPSAGQYAQVVTVPLAGRGSSSRPGTSRADEFEVPDFPATSSGSGSSPAASSGASSTVPPRSSTAPPSSSAAPPSSSAVPPSSSAPPPATSDPPVPSAADPGSSSQPSSSSSEEPSSSQDDEDEIPNFYEDGSVSQTPSSDASSEDDGDDIIFYEDDGRGGSGYDDDSIPNFTETRSMLGGSATSYADELSVYADGKYVTGDALDIVSRIVQSEVGSGFHEEAIKAQAVAAHSFIAYHNNTGTSPTVLLASSADQKVQNAVSQVIGDLVYYGGKVAFTPYHATSAGTTTSSKDVWGGSYAYLVSVDSSVDSAAKNYAVSTTMTREQVESLLRSKLGIEADGDPSGWFEILSYADGGYIGAVRVCGYTKSPRAGSTITGRVLRENVLSLRSACFDVEYDSQSDKFIFTTYGYGHGVGMSQNGANLYARQGWDYAEILEHYYPGSRVY